MKRPRLVLIVPVVAGITALGLSGCGSISKVPTAPAAVSGTTSASPSSSPSGNSTTGGLGTVFRFNDGAGNVMTVKCRQLLDPATASDSFEAAPAGKRLVAAVFTLKGISGSTNDDANNDASLVGTNGQSYSPAFDSIAGYTNFNNGMFTVTAGVKSVGAVVFEVPVSVKIAEVQWSPSSGMGGTPVTWTAK